MSTVKIALLGLVPKLTGCISFISSSTVVIDVLKDARKRQTTYHRLVVGMSVSDALSSLAFFLGTWPMPSGTEIWGAVGTLFTCDVVGFLGQSGTAGTYLYNVTLATYYLLMLKYHWETRRLKKAEPFLHAFSLIISLTFSITGLIKQQYGGAVYLCWIGPYPANCDSPETCERGYNYQTYRWAFGFLPNILSLLYLAIAMFAVYLAVRKDEKSSKLTDYVEEGEEMNGTVQEGNNDITNRTIVDRREEIEDAKTEEKIDLSVAQPPPRLPLQQRSRSKPALLQTDAQRKAAELLKKKNEKSKRIMVQAFLYVAAVFLTWTFSTILRILLTLNPGLTREESVTRFYPWLLLGSIFQPLQGLFNCLIYFRYRIARSLRNRRQDGVVNTTSSHEVQDGEFNLQEWLASRNNVSRPNDQGGAEEMQVSGVESLGPSSLAQNMPYDEYDAENDYY